jgi:uncharacterized protein YdeI (YjbR/CyaY-like superfamily)
VPKRSSPPRAPVFFASAADLRTWLERHADSAGELIVGFHKVGSGVPSLTWPESVDEALCFGWIDGVRKRIDERAYQIRFTPRRPGSVWSAVNVARARDLIAAGRMTPRGLATFEERTEARSRVDSYERSREPELTPSEAARFRKNRRAWGFFERTPPSYRRGILHWIASARRPETRERRLARLIAACAAGQRLMP